MSLAPRARLVNLTDKSKQYRYHHNDGHTTEECVSLKDRIKELIQEEALNNYIYNPNNNKDGYRGRGRNRRGHKDSWGWNNQGERQKQVKAKPNQSN